jgi:hypothetical protein
MWVKNKHKKIIIHSHGMSACWGLKMPPVMHLVTSHCSGETGIVGELMGKMGMYWGKSDNANSH